MAPWVSRNVCADRLDLKPCIFRYCLSFENSELPVDFQIDGEPHAVSDLLRPFQRLINVLDVVEGEQTGAASGANKFSFGLYALAALYSEQHKLFVCRG